jgi:hypothetical protein
MRARSLGPLVKTRAFGMTPEWIRSGNVALAVAIKCREYADVSDQDMCEVRGGVRVEAGEAGVCESLSVVQ